MLTKITLKNFKVHQDLIISFGSGLQTIRGEVEAGKSSLIQGIAYGLFGSAVLDETLAETVTWGLPDSSLRVELEFMHAGQPFSLYRAKAGAELTGAGVRASGQAEVTKFVEGLFGCTAAIAKQVLLASQGNLRGALDKGPGEAVELIEDLGDIGLLDTIIGKIQEKLPCGSTATLEAMIAQDALAEPPAQVDLSALQAALAGKTQPLTELKKTLAELEAEVAKFDVAGAHQVLGEARAAGGRLARATKAQLDGEQAVAASREELVRLEALPIVDVADLMTQRAAASDAARQRRVKTQMEGLLKDDTATWEGSVEDLVRASNEADETIKRLKADGQKEAVLVASLSAQRITETACGLCGKDLSNVPEVVAKNSALAERIATSTQRQQDIKLELHGCAADRTELDRIRVAHRDRLDLAQREPDLVEYGVSKEVPGPLRWIGPATIAEVGTNFDALIKQANDQAQRLDAARSKLDRQCVQLQGLDTEHGLAVSALNALDVDKANTTLARATEAQAAVSETFLAVRASEKDVLQASQALRDAEAAHEAQVRVYQAAQQRLEGLRTNLAAMQLHNQVIKRVREARPVVANKVWALVLATVSQYFSQVRGTPSVVTRGEKGFAVDGKSAKSLSGSTKDSLGLAIRLALAKTFLPSLGFLILDEPAAACSDSRESAMLGLLSACDFDQILMVTHSDLADAYSSSIIQL